MQKLSQKLRDLAESIKSQKLNTKQAEADSAKILLAALGLEHLKRKLS